MLIAVPVYSKRKYESADKYQKTNVHFTVESSFNQVITLVILVTLSPPSFIPIVRNTLPPFIQCGQELIIKIFWIQCEQGDVRFLFSKSANVLNKIPTFYWTYLLSKHKHKCHHIKMLACVNWMKIMLVPKSVKKNTSKIWSYFVGEVRWGVIYSNLPFLQLLICWNHLSTLIGRDKVSMRDIYTHLYFTA